MYEKVVALGLCLCPRSWSSGEQVTLGLNQLNTGGSAHDPTDIHTVQVMQEIDATLPSCGMNFGPLTGNICLQNFRTTCPCHHPATVDDKKEWSEVKVGEIITKCPKGGKLEGRAVAGQLNMFARACLDAGAKSVFVICMTGTSTNSKRFYNHIDRSVFELVHEDGTHPSNLVTFRPAWLGYEGQANKMEELMGPLSEKVEELYKKHGITQSKTIIQALRDSKNIHFIKPIGMTMGRAERRWRRSLSAAQREQVDRYEHIFQQGWFKNQGSKYQQAVVAAGGHLFQQPEFIAEGTERQNVLVRQGLHLPKLDSRSRGEKGDKSESNTFEEVYGPQ